MGFPFFLLSSSELTAFMGISASLRDFLKLSLTLFILIIFFTSLFVIAIGVHGLVHLGVEQNYGFNPYRWF